ncbi:flagellar protein FlgN [Paenibacillus sp. YYML68]|uniref:flagellar protein FlgN n=1 Tax=Paenibacillus sp. YYML68 TaxID=2909250 RepID=UPI00248FAB7C|nr:flagellar protein FlgN [Paenibacillus sp. YYML68]
MSFHALLQVMSELNEAHLVLMELAERKKDVLVHNQVDQLTQIVNKENKQIKLIGELDQRRIQVIGDFLMEKGYKPNPRVTISDLRKIIFDVEEKRQLMDAQKQLLDTIHRLRRVNTLNQQLIEQSIAFVDYSIDLMVGPAEEDVTYHSPQQQPISGKRPGIFDAKA